MSIRKKNNGKYEVRVYVGYDNQKMKRFYINQDIAQTTKDVVAGYFKRHILIKKLFGGLYLDNINKRVFKTR